MDGYTLVCKTRRFLFSSSGSVVCELDKNMFTECVRAVVDNAIKYSEDDTEIQVSSIKRGGYAEIKISVQGKGIRPRICRYFQTDFTLQINPGTAISTAAAWTYYRQINRGDDGRNDRSRERARSRLDLYVEISAEGGKQ